MSSLGLIAPLQRAGDSHDRGWEGGCIVLCCASIVDQEALHTQSCFGHFPSGLLQYSLHGVALEEHPEVSVSTKCNRLVNYGCASSFPCYTFAPANLLPGAKQGAGNMEPGYLRDLIPTVSIHPIRLGRRSMLQTLLIKDCHLRGPRKCACSMTKPAV